MKQTFTTTLWEEGNWFVAQCLEVDIVSQGEIETEALTNLREALLLHLQPPVATITAKISTFEVKLL